MNVAQLIFLVVSVEMIMDGTFREYKEDAPAAGGGSRTETRNKLTNKSEQLSEK